MGRITHHIDGGDGIRENDRERIAADLGDYLDALARLHEDVELLNHTQAVEFFSAEYDRAVEFATREFGFDIRIAGSEEPQL